jgi:hypothetical protein
LCGFTQPSIFESIGQSMNMETNSADRYLFFLVLAVVGFLSLLTIHIAAFAGVTPPSVILKFVFVGLFVVWLPAIFVSNRLSREYKQNDFWRATLRGCPKWMRTALWVIWGYGSLGTFLLPLLLGRNVDSYGSSTQGASGFVMAFYATAVCILIQLRGRKNLTATGAALMGITFRRWPNSVRNAARLSRIIQIRSNSASFAD